MKKRKTPCKECGHPLTKHAFWNNDFIVGPCLHYESDSIKDKFSKRCNCNGGIR